MKSAILGGSHGLRLTESTKEVYKERDESKMCVAIPRYIVAHTSGQKRPEHVRKSEQQQSAAAEGINGPDSRPSK